VSDVPEEFKIASEDIDAYLERLKKILTLEQRNGRYRDFVMSFANEPMEMSFEKLPDQYADWKRMAQRLLDDLEGDK
jgi:hypothetical protein